MSDDPSNPSGHRPPPGGPDAPGGVPPAPGLPAAPHASPPSHGPTLPPPPPMPGFGDALPPAPGADLALRPMGVGEILDSAMRLYRRHWKVLLEIVALVQVPFQFLQMYIATSVEHPFVQNGRLVALPRDLEAVTIVRVGFLFVAFLVIVPFLTAAVARAVSESYLGHQPSVREAYRYSLSRLGSILLVVLLAGLAIMGGLILLVIPGVIIYTRFAFGTAVVVVEDLRGRAALRRSWGLAKGSTGRIFLTLFLAGLMASLVSGVLVVPVTLLAGTIGPKVWLLQAAAGALSSVLTTPFATMIPVLLYFDMRIRKEGFDLAIEARRLGPGDA